VIARCPRVALSRAGLLSKIADAPSVRARSPLRYAPVETLPRKTEEIDLLNDVGADGWELVSIMSNKVAYLKRLRGASKRRTRNASR
jgi:hypothetical protein